MSKRTLVVTARDHNHTYPGDHTYSSGVVGGPFGGNSLHIFDANSERVATFQEIYWSAVEYVGGDDK